MSITFELFLVFLAALLPIPPVGAVRDVGTQAFELRNVFSADDPLRADRLPRMTFQDDHDPGKMENFNDLMGHAGNKKEDGPQRSTSKLPANTLPEPTLQVAPTVSRFVSPRVSAGDLDSTKKASLLVASTMRGFTLAQRRAPPRSEADYAALAAYGANLARIGVLLDVDAGVTEFSISQPERDYMQTTVAMAEKYGFKVVITITAGATRADDQAVWGNRDLQASLETVWASIATQFKDNPAIAGYELINEPKEPRHRTGQPFNPAGPDEWRPLSIRIINAIRKVDPKSIIVWMPSPGGPEMFWPGFNNPITPLPFENIVYSIHFYVPHPTTHQGVGSYPLNQPYPHGYKSSKAYLIDRLQYAKAFGEMHGVPIFVGEFGFNRNSPPGSREQWFEDCIGLFEQYGWNWAVHAFRNWEGWDTEIGPEVPAYAAGPRRPDAPVITMLKRKFLLNP